MSPIERQRTFGKLPIESWKPTKTGQVLRKVGTYDLIRQINEHGMALLRIEVVDQETIAVTWASPPMTIVGEGLLYKEITLGLKRKEINEFFEDLQPFRTVIPLIGQRVRWREE